MYFHFLFMFVNVYLHLLTNFVNYLIWLLTYIIGQNQLVSIIARASTTRVTDPGY